uniref:DOMON domain-containing protein n=1 Tax=Leersia perrieri TaxID=77586 RepID=A0A0D9VQN8_9ORYZ
MARLSDSACLLAVAVLLSAEAAATAQPAAADCTNATFQAGRSYQRCSNLPVLGATLHWTYHAENGTADIAFRAPQTSSGWVAWGINTQNGTGMVGSSVFIASQLNGTAATSVITTVLESFRPSLRNGTLGFGVPAPPAAEYTAGAYTIYATVALPGNATTQNTVWQAGPVRGGAIAMHPTTGPNLKSTKRHDFLSG